MKYPPPEPGQKRHCALCGRLSGWEGKAAAFSDGYSPERGLLQRGAIGFAGSDGEAEVDDVAVGDGVVFTFEGGKAGFFGLLFGTGFDEVVVGDDLGADEAAFDIGMDLAGGLGCEGAFTDRPGADLVFTDGEEGDEAEEVEGLAGEAVDGGFGEAEGFEEFVAFLFGLELTDLQFLECVEEDGLDLAWVGDGFGEAIGFALFVAVDDDQERFEGEEAETADAFGLFGGELDGTERLFLFEDGDTASEGFEFFSLLAVAGAFEFAFEFIGAFLGEVEVGDEEFEGEGLDISKRIDAGGGVEDGGVLEATHDVADGVHLADFGEPLVLALLIDTQGGEEVELDLGRLLFMRLVHLTEDVEPGVADMSDPLDRLARLEFMPSGFGAGEELKEGMFAGLWQSDDSEFHDAAHAKRALPRVQLGSAEKQ